VGAFGEKLRKQREQQGIGLDAISGTTKISTRMLRALEEEHFDQLPGGVFNKGFVRAYARQVGLNEEEAVADYLDAVRENQLQARSLSPDFRDLPGNDLNGHDLHGDDLPDSDVPSNPPSKHARKNRSQPLPANDRRKQSRRSEDRRNDDQRNEARRPADRSEDRHSEARNKEDRRPKNLSPPPDSPTSGLAAQLPWGKLAVALLLLTFALALWNSRRHREPSATAQPTASSPQSPAPVSAPASGSAPILPAAKASPAKTLSSGKFSPGTISTASSPSPATNASITLPVPPPPSKAAPTAPTQAESRGSVPAPSTNAPRANPTFAEGTASAAPAKPPSSFRLLIRAEETSWVSITADGKPVAQETLIAPAHTSVRASGEVVVKAGNAAGISFQLNGEDLPAQGNEGEVKTYVFDAAEFRILPQAQSPAAIR
jgi:cytoskeletal protein RodZ